MKALNKILFFLTALVIFQNCRKDEVITDPVYEFVFFTAEGEIFLDEETFSIQGYPVVARLLTFTPYQEDIQLGLEVTTSNASSGVDFELVSGSNMVIRAGNFTSDTLFVKTIDNDVEETGSRSVSIKIISISKPGIKIGLGLANPVQDLITFAIVNDDYDALCKSSFWKGVLETEDVPWPEYSPADVIGTTTDCGLLSFAINDFWGEPGAAVTLDLQLNDDGTVSLLTDTQVEAYGTIIDFQAGDAGTYDLASHQISLKLTTDYSDGQVTDGYYRLNAGLCAAGIFDGNGILLDDEWPDYPPNNPEVVMSDCNTLSVSFGIWGYTDYTSEFILSIGSFDPKTNEAIITLQEDVTFDHDGYNMVFKAGDAGKYNLDDQQITLNITMDEMGDGSEYNGATYEFTVKLP